MSASPERGSPRLSAGQLWQIHLARARRWEFWPAWLFYIPVVGWILLLGLRHRHFTLFTAANPGMENGSVVGERKSQSLLPLQTVQPDFVPLTRLLPEAAGPALDIVREMVAAVGWPLVLKPDIGQRGRGVAIVASEAAVRRYLGVARFHVLAQAYEPGLEYGVFIRRQPGSGAFEISSITHKALPRLMGDGRRSVGELILAHSRAWLIAPQLFAQHRSRLSQTLAAGQEWPLVELGAHCRGAEFRDAGELASEALRDWAHALAAALPGFHYGRIDLRCTGDDALRQAAGLKILEVNGVTSEPAHVYHPGTPLWRGVACFCAHWTRAFALGHENRAAGATTLSAWKLLRLFLQDLSRFDNCEAAALAARAAPQTPETAMPC